MSRTGVISGADLPTLRRGFGISIVFYLVYVSYYISGFSSQHHNYVLAAMFALWAFFAILEDIQSFIRTMGSRVMIWILLFVVYFFVTSLEHGNLTNTMEYIIKYVMLFFCVLQFRYYKLRRRRGELMAIAVCALGVWIFFAVKAIAFYISVPSAARILASDFYAFDDIAIGGGYAIAFGSALLCVYLFECLINRGAQKRRLVFVFLAMIVILFYLLIKTESTLTLIACAAGIVFALLQRLWSGSGARNDLKRFVLSILLISATLLIFFNLQAIGEWLIDVTREGIDNSILRRLHRIGEKMAYSGDGRTYENYIDERFGLILQSWRTFLKNPIIGVGHRYGNIFSKLAANGVGMHSALTDLFAQHGILGGIPFVMIFVSAFRGDCRMPYNAHLFTLLFMVVVNPFDYFHAYFAVFTLIPLINMLIVRCNRKRESSHGADTTQSERRCV